MSSEDENDIISDSAELPGFVKVRKVRLGAVCFPLLQRFVAPPIKDGLQQYGEGCGARFVQALLGDASSLKCFSMFFQCVLFRGRRMGQAIFVAISVALRMSVPCTILEMRYTLACTSSRTGCGSYSGTRDGFLDVVFTAQRRREKQTEKKNNTQNHTPLHRHQGTLDDAHGTQPYRTH